MCRECDLQAKRGAIGMRAQRDSCGAEKHGPVASHGRRLAAGFLVGNMNGLGMFIPVARPSRLQPEDLRRDAETALCESPTATRTRASRDGHHVGLAKRDVRFERRRPVHFMLSKAARSLSDRRTGTWPATVLHAPTRRDDRMRIGAIARRVLACVSVHSHAPYCLACCARMPTTTHTAIPKRTDIKKTARVARAGSTIAATATALRPSPPRAHLR